MSSLAPKPKVVAAVVGGIVASSILSNITLITPDLFDGLGKFGPLIYGLTLTLVMGLCGWLKSEGAAAETGKDATPGDTPASPQPDPVPAAVSPRAAVEATAAAPAVEVSPVVPS